MSVLQSDTNAVTRGDERTSAGVMAIRGERRTIRGEKETGRRIRRGREGIERESIGHRGEREREKYRIWRRTEIAIRSLGLSQKA
jgi:hypothetical protein